MQPINLLGIETAHGFRTVELFHGDITRIDFHADVVVISAFAGSYIPAAGTVIAALRQHHGIDVESYSKAPALDLREALGVWISAPLRDGVPYGRILCAELIGSPEPLPDALDNAFAGLMLLEAKNIGARVVALPLLGAGLQSLDAEHIAAALVQRAKAHLERSPSTVRLAFVEIDADRANAVSDAMDRVLGRKRVVLPREQLDGALRQDISNMLRAARTLFSNGCEVVQHEWLRLLQQNEVRSIEFGISARKLVELMVDRVGAPSRSPLAERIRSLEKSGKIAPWICGYMHVLRHLGNEAAHESPAGTEREPRVIAPADLTAGLFCVQRLLDFWIGRQEQASLP